MSKARIIGNADKKSVFSLLDGKARGLIFLAAFAAGLCNAALGAGGGIILAMALGRICPRAFPDNRSLLATTQGAMIPCCILSCAVYYLRGELPPSGVAFFILPALIGGAIGAFLLERIKPKLIIRLFSVLVIWSGARMITG